MPLQLTKQRIAVSHYLREQEFFFLTYSFFAAVFRDKEFAVGGFYIFIELSLLSGIVS